MKTYLFLIIATIFIAASCNKEHKPIGDFAWCKVDGQRYEPDGWPNKNVCRIIRDTIFTFGISRGWESIGIALHDSNGISVKTYKLSNALSGNASYDNSVAVDDIFRTDPNHTGILTITYLDRVSKRIEGTFSFKAFNPVQNKMVIVSDGEFRLPYTTN